jgi:hypothetical protein
MEPYVGMHVQLDWFGGPEAAEVVSVSDDRHTVVVRDHNGQRHHFTLRERTARFVKAGEPDWTGTRLIFTATQ